MNRQTQLRGWDRHEWAEGATGFPDPQADAEPAIAAWNLIQWVGDRPGLVREPAVLDIETDGLPHGFSGFGISDSGGQRWASSSSSAAEYSAPVAIHETRSEAA
jgi:hypothetical protein